MYLVHQERQCRTVSSRQLHRRVSAESDLVQRLERQRVLDGHAGCVNTAVSGLRNGWDARKFMVDNPLLLRALPSSLEPGTVRFMSARMGCGQHNLYAQRPACSAIRYPRLQLHALFLTIMARLADPWISNVCRS